MLPHVEIGSGCTITRSIIDEGCEIPDGMQIGMDRAAMRTASTSPRRASCW